MYRYQYVLYRAAEPQKVPHGNVSRRSGVSVIWHSRIPILRYVVMEAPLSTQVYTPVLAVGIADCRLRTVNCGLPFQPARLCSAPSTIPYVVLIPPSTVYHSPE